MTSLSFSFPRMRRLPLLRTGIDRVLAASMLFSCILVGLRILHTGRLTFLSMIWNLFLAYIPYAISGWLVAKPAKQARQARPMVQIIALLLWLLFIPNSFYILTDLYHLADSHRNSLVPEWFDLALILSFAWNGLLLGVLSIRHIERRFISGASVFREWLFLYPVMWLNALGVYVGRYLRYNSWDIFLNPFQLLADIFGMIVHPLRHHYAWDMIFCFSILLTLMYSLIRKGSAALA
jgi:uncharacterized membrane protein